MVLLNGCKLRPGLGNGSDPPAVRYLLTATCTWAISKDNGSLVWLFQGAGGAQIPFDKMVTTWHTCVYIFVDRHVCMHVCRFSLYASTNICRYVCMHVWVYVKCTVCILYAGIYVCMCERMYFCKHVCFGVVHALFFIQVSKKV